MDRFCRCVIVGVAIVVCGDMLAPCAGAQLGWLPAMVSPGRSGTSHCADTAGSFVGSMYGLVSGVSSPTVDVIPAATNVTEQQSFVVAVQVASEPGVPGPTGTVALRAGSFRGSVPLEAGGEAAVTVPGGVLTAGTDVLTASYTPDVASAPYYGEGSGEAMVVVYPEPAYFSIAALAITIASGDTTGTTVTVTVTPYRGFSGWVNLTASITGAPRQVYDLPRLSFGATSPVRIADGTAGRARLTISTGGNAGLAAEGEWGIPAAPAGGAMLVALMMLTWPVRRKKWMQRRTMRMLHTGAVALFSLWLMGCGASGPLGTGTGTTPGNYTVTVTGVAGGVSSTGEFKVTVR